MANVTTLSHGLYYIKNEDIIISLSKLLRIPVFWGLGNVNKQMTVIFSTFQEALTKSPVLRNVVPGVESIDHFVALTLQIKFLQKKLTFILASCLKSKITGDAFMISAWPGMGKTEISLKLLRSNAYHYISDDLTLIDREGYAYAFPRPTTIRKGFFYRVQVDPVAASWSELPDAHKTSKVRNLYILEYSQDQTITQLDRHEALRRLSIIMRNVLSYSSERTIVAYAYVNNEFNIDDLLEVQKEVLHDFLRKVPNFMLVRCSGPESALEMIRKTEL